MLPGDIMIKPVYILEGNIPKIKLLFSNFSQNLNLNLNMSIFRVTATFGNWPGQHTDLVLHQHESKNALTQII